MAKYDYSQVADKAIACKLVVAIFDFCEQYLFSHYAPDNYVFSYDVPLHSALLDALVTAGVAVKVLKGSVKLTGVDDDFSRQQVSELGDCYKLIPAHLSDLAPPTPVRNIRSLVKRK